MGHRLNHLLLAALWIAPSLAIAANEPTVLLQPAAGGTQTRGTIDWSYLTGSHPSPSALGAEPARAEASQAQAEAGTGTTVLGWTPQRIAQAIASLTVEIDPAWAASPSHGITSTQVTNWDAAYGWGNPAGVYAPLARGLPAGGASGLCLAKTAGTDYSVGWTSCGSGGAGSSAWGSITGSITDQTDLSTALAARPLASTLGTAAYVAIGAFDSAGSAATVAGDLATHAAARNPHGTTPSDIGAATATQGGHADTAYGWGPHAAAGYLTSYSETDPAWAASASHGITSTQVGHWDAAYGWGDPAGVYAPIARGLPAGGASGLCLAKTAGTDYSVGWTSCGTGGGGSVAWGAITGTLADQSDLGTALAGKASTSHSQAASTISDSTAAGRALLTGADAAAQRTSLGLGSAATTAASAYATAAQGTDARTPTAHASTHGAAGSDPVAVAPSQISASGATSGQVLGWTGTAWAPQDETDHSAVTLASPNRYLSLSGQQITAASIDLTAHVTGALPVSNGGTGAATAAAARTALGVDPAGADNSTPVSLGGSLTYLTLSGQTITRNAVNLGTDVTGIKNLPTAAWVKGDYSTSQVVTATAGTYYQVTTVLAVVGSTDSTGILTWDSANKWWTASQACTVLVSGSLAITSSSSSVSPVVAVRINESSGAQTNLAGGQASSTSFLFPLAGAIVSLAAGQRLSLWFYAPSSFTYTVSLSGVSTQLKALVLAVGSL